MTMDFSQLHTYTPPQCSPENTGYTYSLSSSYSTAALEFEKEHQIAPVYESPRMSRRSLRLQSSAGHYDNEGLADYCHNQSSSYTNKETRTVRSRKHQQQQQSLSSSMSLSLSQVATPRQTLSFSAVSTPIDGSSRVQESSTESEASQLTSAYSRSQMRKQSVSTISTTSTVDVCWVQSSAHKSSANGGASSSKSHVALSNGYICNNCSLHSQKTNTCTAKSSCQAQELSTQALSSSSSSPFTSVYTRDRSRKNKTGVLMSVSNTCMRYSKQALVPIVSLVTLLLSSVVQLGSRAVSLSGKGIPTAFLDSVRRASSSSLSKMWLFRSNILRRMIGSSEKYYEDSAHSSISGSTNISDQSTEDASHLNLNGSQCNDSTGKHYSATSTVLLSERSRSKGVVGALWSVLVFTGYGLLLPGYVVVKASSALASGFYSGAKNLLSCLWLLVTTPVKASKGLLWFLGKGWYQLVSLMSLLNVFFLTQCVPRLWKLLLFLLPFLLLLVLWLWGPSAATLFAYLPTINLTEWNLASPFSFSNFKTIPASVPATEPPMKQAPVAPVSQATPVLPPSATLNVDLKRLEDVEHQLALLWERVKQEDEQQEQRHQDIFSLYTKLREQLHTQTNRESLGVWVSSLLEERLGTLRENLEQANTQRTQSEKQQEQQQESQDTRLAELELLLKALSVKTEEMQQKQQQYERWKEEKEKEVVPPAAETPVSVGVKQESHDALLVEVQRLEAELAKIRQELQAVVGCKGKCEQLDTLQETISAQVSSQVRRELQVLFFGPEDQQSEVPESLISWLSQRYVSTPNLQAALASLELNILKNISQQLELSRAQTVTEAEFKAQNMVQTITGTVQHTSSSEGLTEEQVKLIVQNALRLFSQDKTGRVDYALESGGGSILSTRCSETYETKTALMSLFGLPLWYFSQSPRVVIQPDVYPGNCWAFKGSQGYLVIRLSLRILPTSFCLEHIPKALSPTGNITSAPRNFTVFGLDDEYQDKGKLLGHYTYEENGEALQIFPVKEENDKTFQIIEVRVLSNWGHPEYTCLYRFRVHGEPRPE
ncbi:SUN domain-containing protein 1 [Oryzias melastigma]|uniref:SUN domain-containing protein 1 n=1 Tax=Oryzias melastigma TaxID=30732 RepID=A0A834CH82_ORYME|nr:SUN domain-containing protein 1 [Oryzias melastigma]